MRIVIGTNTLVSFAIRPDPGFERIIDHIAAHGVALVSDDTIAELFDVLRRYRFRKYLRSNQSIGYVEWYAGISGQIVVTDHVVACRDPTFERFLAVAVSGKADRIFAGDRHPPEMIRFRGIRYVVAPIFHRCSSHGHSATR